MISVKRATQADIPNLLRIAQRVLSPEEAAVDEIVLTYRLEAHGWWFRKVTIEKACGGFFCGRQMQGTTLSADLYGCDTVAAGETFALLDLVIDVEKQGQGLGMLLLKDLIYLCQERGLWRIVTACPATCTGFFTRYGFRPCAAAAPLPAAFGRAAWTQLQLDL